MVRVRFQSKEDNIISFAIKGHAIECRDAALAEEAYNMICNSVSASSQSAIIDLDEVLKLNVNYEMSNGYLRLDLNGFNHEEIVEAQVLLKTFEANLVSLALRLDNSLGKKTRCKCIEIMKGEV